MVNQVLQNGQVTPGHFVTWVTDGIVQDGGPITASQKVLSKFTSANFNSTADQPLLIPAAIKVFTLTSIIVTNASVSLTTAVGGFYTAVLKGGTALVSGGQNYAALTNSSLLMNPTLTGFTGSARLSSANLGTLAGSTTGSLAIYFSLSTPQGAAATADIYLIGIDLS